MKAVSSPTRPARWLSGRKFTLMIGVSRLGAAPEDQKRVTVHSVNIAPLGAPVLPEVYMIRAVR
ncbi:Uncharacterised protein [Mycobacteroides abscessus subsp. abscessus]|nr:Uncharacterised protein [Mycobacteroides abscessus subsp. abscessus]SKV32519.1 Uncharacterised protein [Mycobacteroides abscessus subsp. abscessus]